MGFNLDTFIDSARIIACSAMVSVITVLKIAQGDPEDGGQDILGAVVITGLTILHLFSLPPTTVPYPYFSFSLTLSLHFFVLFGSLLEMQKYDIK